MGQKAAKYEKTGASLVKKPDVTGVARKGTRQPFEDGWQCNHPGINQNLLAN